MAPALTSRAPRILFLDAYDSFSNNIISLVEETIGAEVITLKIDATIKSSLGLPGFIQQHKIDAVIAGPGPGTAANPADVGLIGDLWQLGEEDVLPVLGVCLGFQSLALAFGAKIERLQVPRHGIVTEVLHNDHSIFKDIGEIQATQYHSLCVNIGHSIQTKRAVSHPNQLWRASELCPDLEPLAWDCSSIENGATLMALRHRSKPFWGVQYHPESICTNDEGAKIFENWWNCVQEWNMSMGRRKFSSNNVHTKGLFCPLPNLDDANCTEPSYRITGDNATPARTLAHYMTACTDDSPGEESRPIESVQVSTCGSGRLRVSDICTLLGIPEDQAVVLESGLREDLTPINADTGRYSIIGLRGPYLDRKIYYYTGKRTLNYCVGSGLSCLEFEVSDFWAYLKDVMGHLRPRNMPRGASAPFWGGLMGYVSYEAGLETIGVTPSPGPDRPDVCFQYVERSIVIDHSIKKIYIQSIAVDDAAWIARTADVIYQAVSEEDQRPWKFDIPAELPEVSSEVLRHSDSDKRIVNWAASKTLSHYLSQSSTTTPAPSSYVSKVSACQSHISAGDSYELCLTDQTSILLPTSRPSTALPWLLYQRLQSLNPAPFSAYISLSYPTPGAQPSISNFSTLNILSSSPERFLSWTRSGVSTSRPIKGTVSKTAHPNLTRADAEAMLNCSKERAENLMIVDLTRHQMHAVYGAGNVSVPQLMQVEEYETVFQLVSVVEGRPATVSLPTTPEEWQDPFSAVAPVVLGEGRAAPAVSGIDVLRASLPAGSMTGAPKKRSCELLKEIEEDVPRGVYSGAIGYLEVGGGGDFSVVIRTAVRWEDEKKSVVGDDGVEREYEIWRVGAGGAVTSQSDPTAEWEEMCAKRDSTLRMFEPPKDVPDKPVKEDLMESTARTLFARFIDR